MNKVFPRAIAICVMLFIAQLAFAQKITVTGQVLDATDGMPLIGAGVISSTGEGTITDYDGNYVIKVEKDASLTFSTLGYLSATEPVNGRTVINVSLSPDTQVLEEVVVLGFTSQKKAELTSAVVTVNSEKLTDVTTPDVGNMLQGKVAGVMVMNSSGQPGEGATIRIRGTGSINAGAGPLYVVDGVAGGAFNPNDIETLTVLKDASATALYGAAASGGVIVITTKTAKSDKAQVNFKASVGVKRALMGRFKPMDAKELYDFYSLFRSDSWLGKVSNVPSKEDIDAGKYNFNWVKNTFKTGLVRNYYASVSGMSGKVSYYTSLDHYNEEGSLINSGYRRTAARINLSAPITDKLTMTLRANYSKDYTNSGRWKTRESAYVMLPFDNPFTLDKEGNVISNEPVLINTSRRPDANTHPWYSKNTYNYFHNELYNYARGHGDSLVGDLQLVWSITDWLTFTSTNRYDTSNYFSEEYFDPRTTEVDDGKGALANSESEWSGWGTTNLLKFHHTVGGGELSAVLGWEYGEGYSRELSAEGDQMPAGQRSLSNTIMKSVGGRDFNTRTWALLSQAQYSYLGKYILTASLRYDESYKFGPLNRGGFFPGVSGAWVMSSEDFMSGNNLFSFFKVRAGYGKTGNDNIPAFKYQDIFDLSAQYNNVVAAFVKQQANNTLGWEEAYMTSLGIDATTRRNTNITVDLYHTINAKLLLERPMPPSSGFFSMMDNVGKVRNMGIEVAVDGTLLKRGDFLWDGGFNIGVNQNRVLELPGHNDIAVGDKVKQMIIEGRDIYSWYMPKWAGVDYETGMPLWEHLIYDENGNVEKVMYVDSYKDATPQIVGSASPWFTGGLNTSLSWKSFTLSATGSFVVGNKIFNATRMNIMDTDGAQPGFNLQSLDNGLGWMRWRDPDSAETEAERQQILRDNRYNVTHPQPLNGGNSDAHNYSSRYLEDGSFFRLRNVTFSYDLPQKLLSKVKLSSARIYVSADNILTFTRFSGMDPEVSLEMSTYSLAGLYSDNYPVPMSVVLGIDVKF